MDGQLAYPVCLEHEDEGEEFSDWQVRSLRV